MNPIRARHAAAALALTASAATVPVVAHAAAPSAARTAAVTIKDIRFNPRAVTVARGGSVTWRWRDGDTTHNVTIRHGRRSANKQSGTFTVRFLHAGTFRYQCTLHPGMTGRVVVR